MGIYCILYHTTPSSLPFSFAGMDDTMRIKEKGLSAPGKAILFLWEVSDEGGNHPYILYYFKDKRTSYSRIFAASWGGDGAGTPAGVVGGVYSPHRGLPQSPICWENRVLVAAMPDSSSEGRK